MRNIKKIFIVVFSLILLFAVSCSNDDKTGVANNPPEDTEITDGETGSGGTGSSSGGDSGTETGGGSGTGTGGDGTETGGGSGTGGDSGMETKTIEAKDFPTELLGTYRDERLPNEDKFRNAKVSLFGQDIWMKGYQMRHKKDGSADGIQSMDSKIKKWTKTTKGGKIIKLEGESFSTQYDFDTGETTTVAKTVIIYDYENKTVSMTFTTYIPDGVDASFYGKKID